MSVFVLIAFGATWSDNVYDAIRQACFVGATAATETTGAEEIIG